MFRKSTQLLRTLKWSQNSVNQVSRQMSLGTRKHEGKVAIVTASTDGIGLAIAERLGMEGAKVIGISLMIFME